MTNGEKLRELIQACGLTQEEARALVNIGQARPIAKSSWQAYLSATTSKRWRNCPESVLQYARDRLSKHKK